MVDIDSGLPMSQYYYSFMTGDARKYKLEILVAAKCPAESAAIVYPRRFQSTLANKADVYDYDTNETAFYTALCTVDPNQIYKMGDACTIFVDAVKPCSFAFKLLKWSYAEEAQV